MNEDIIVCLITIDTQYVQGAPKNVGQLGLVGE
jgi:hypothetical protein